MSDNEKGEMKMFDYDPESKHRVRGPQESTKLRSRRSREISFSKKNGGDPMLVVHVQVYGAGNTTGQTQTINEYITAPPASSGRKGSLFKLKVIATAVGLLDQFKIEDAQARRRSSANDSDGRTRRRRRLRSSATRTSSTRTRSSIAGALSRLRPAPKKTKPSRSEIRHQDGRSPRPEFHPAARPSSGRLAETK
jgi:hypothetical protein